jgi:hypothetical protein
MAQSFTMRFAFFFPERSKGIFWSGPYQVYAKTVNEAKDILTDAVLKETRREDGPLYQISLLECENRLNPGRNEEHYCCINIGIAEEIHKRAVFREQFEWKKYLEKRFPKGVPKIRSLDAEWDWGDGDL